MWFFYICALIPLFIGLFIWIFNKQVTWWEWICGSLAGFIVAGIIHMVAFIGMTADKETWSGQIVRVEHRPRWVEEYQQMHTRTYTTGSGKNMTTHTQTYYTTEHDTHREHWMALLNFGTKSTEKEISVEFYNEVKQNFGNVVFNGGKQSTHHGGHFDGGDNNIYATDNTTGYVYPSTIVCKFENRIKAAPTVFSFPQVPEGTPVYNWPENPNWLKSDRLIGESRIDILEFDRMNSRLGFRKQVNVIMINFGLQDSTIAQWQQAKWLNGKKNDLVLCYGIDAVGKTTWSMVFGWTEAEIVKRNLETLLLEIPINNDILKTIENEIKTNYIKKDWHKFDYISIDPPRWSYITYIILQLLTQLGLWMWFHHNDHTKIKSGFKYNTLDRYYR